MISSPTGSKPMSKKSKTRSRTETAQAGSVERNILQRLLRKWRRMEKDYMKAVRPEWERGDKYASRRYEGESIALRWCCKDLEAALENAGA